MSKDHEIRKSNKSLGCKRKKRRKQLMDTSQLTTLTVEQDNSGGLGVCESQKSLRGMRQSSSKRHMRLVNHFDGIKKVYN